MDSKVVLCDKGWLTPDHFRGLGMCVCNDCGHVQAIERKRCYTCNQEIMIFYRSTYEATCFPDIVVRLTKHEAVTLSRFLQKGNNGAIRECLGVGEKLYRQLHPGKFKPEDSFQFFKRKHS